MSVCDGPNKYDPGYTGPSLGVAAGDLTGDGIDEIAWAGLSSVWVYQVDPSDSTLQMRTSATRPLVFNDPSRRVVEIADLDASGQDVTDWVPEVIIQDWGGPGGCQRLRVFRADVNTAADPDSITGLTQLCTYDDVAVPKVQGDVAMVFGDFDGDGIRLGSPTRVEITDLIQPVVILGSPPIHFDVFDEHLYDLCGCYPGGGIYACDDFRATYALETSGEYAINTEVKSDWGFSSSLHTSTSVYALCFKLGGVENTFTARFGRGFSRTSMQTHSYQATTTVSTSGGDRILADIMNYALWEYPVRDPDGGILGHVAVIEPESPEILTQWFTFDSWASMGGGQAPAISHEPGNVLSYMKDMPATDEYGEMWKAETGPGWLVGNVGAAQSLNADYTWDLQWSDISGGSYSSSWSAGAEIVSKSDFPSFTIPTGIPLISVKVKASLTTKASYDHSELQTHSTSVGERIHLTATLGNLSGAAEAPYSVWPFYYRSEEAGVLVLDYRVLPGGTGTWWDRYRDDPDLSFILPRLHRLAKGIPMEDTTSAYRSPDVRVYPLSAAVGDTVTIVAIVRNFSLVDQNDPVTLRFYAGDPDGAYVPIQDINGQTDFSIAGGIPSREGRSIALQWVVPLHIPTEVRIYAKADPYGALTEVHESNNKAYTEFVAVGGLPVAVPQVAAGEPFTLRQSAPNPFHAATAIGFSLPERGRATLRVYDVAGRLVATLVDAELPPGRHVYRWGGVDDAGRAVAPGIYLYRINAGPHVETRRLVRLR